MALVLRFSIPWTYPGAGRQGFNPAGSLSTGFHKYDGVSGSTQRRPARAAIMWPSATALGERWFPCLRSPYPRLDAFPHIRRQSRDFSTPSFAAGQTMPALTGLAKLCGSPLKQFVFPILFTGTVPGTGVCPPMSCQNGIVLRIYALFVLSEEFGLEIHRSTY